MDANISKSLWEPNLLGYDTTEIADKRLTQAACRHLLCTNSGIVRKHDVSAVAPQSAARCRATKGNRRY